MRSSVVLLGAVLIYLFQLSTGEEVNCLDSAYCSLIKGDVAKASDKFGKDPAKHYKESQDFLSKGVEFNKSKTEAIQNECQTAYRTCSDEVFTMAVDGLNFPAALRDTCNFETFSRNIFACKNVKDWPADVRKALPFRRVVCRTECVIDEDKNYTLSNGKKLTRIPIREDFDMTSMPEDLLEPKYRPVSAIYLDYKSNRTVEKWLSGLGDTNLAGPGWGKQDVCPTGTLVDATDNFKDSNADNIPLLHIDMLCRFKPAPLNIKIEGHLLSKLAAKIQYFEANSATPTHLTTTPKFSGYDGLKEYVGCSTKFMLGITLERRTYEKGTIGIERVNFLCGDKKEFYGSKADSEEMICDSGMAVCGLQTKIGSIESKKYGKQDTIVDVRIGCCNTSSNQAPDAMLVRPRPVVIPATSPPVTTVTNTNTEDGIFNHQSNFFLIWGGVLSRHITRYNYYYSPYTVAYERNWEVTKCADGTFVNSFEVTTPVSNYFWTRRIMQIKFQCGAADGSKPNELDLYKKLVGKGCPDETVCTLQNPDTEFSGRNECKGGYYTSMEIHYYLDKNRVKLACVNAWALTMTCSKGGPQKHLINSTPSNSVPDNEHVSGVVNCGAGQAICGFNNTLSVNRRGAFEGLYYKVLCCSV